MENEEARRLLAPHVERLRRRSYGELVRYVDEVEAFQVTGESGTIYNIEIQAVWDSGKKGGDLRVLATIDDGRPRWRFLPVVVPEGVENHRSRLCRYSYSRWCGVKKLDRVAR